MSVYEKKASNDYALNAIEYMVKKKPDAAVKRKRALIVLATLVMLGIVFWLISLNPYLGAVLIVLVACITKILWTGTNYEFEYNILQGELTMDVIIGAKKRKTLTSFLIREALAIYPYDGKAPEGARVINACISPEDHRTWCAVYNDADGKKTALLFSAYNKALDTIAYYNRAATSTERIKDEFSA
jgi:hypothetical protein